MKLLKLILVLLVVWVSLSNVSCHNPDASWFITRHGTPRVFTDFPIRWKFGCDFPPNLESPIRNSMDYWQKFTKKKLFIEESGCTFSDLFLYTSNGGLGIILEDKHQPHEWQDGQWVEIWARAPMATMEEKPFAGLIVFYKRWATLTETEVLETVARHELGHFLGFKHSERVDCLMFPSVSENEGLKDACLPEIKLFKEYY